MPRFATRDLNGRHTATGQLSFADYRVLWTIDRHRIRVPASQTQTIHDVKAICAEACNNSFRSGKDCWLYTLRAILRSLQDTQISKIHSFYHPQETGGKRTIKAPTERLELLQLRLAELLTESVKQIERDNPSFYVAAHGFRKGHTIISNANPHRRRRYVFNVDIADFFDSINFGRVRGFFIKDRSFGLAPRSGNCDCTNCLQ